MTLTLKPDNSALAESFSNWLGQHIRCDYSKTAEMLDCYMDMPSQPAHALFHTDITIREMRACVADAGNPECYQTLATDPDGQCWVYHNEIFDDEQSMLRACITTNNLDPAQYAREPKQWLVVSKELRPLLRGKCETVREFASLNIWLRCAVSSDSAEPERLKVGPLEDDPVLREIWQAME